MEQAVCSEHEKGLARLAVECRERASASDSSTQEMRIELSRQIMDFPVRSPCVKDRILARMTAFPCIILYQRLPCRCG